MPMVNGKEYSYDSKGIAEARKAAKKAAISKMQGKSVPAVNRGQGMDRTKLPSGMGAKGKRKNL